MSCQAFEEIVKDIVNLAVPTINIEPLFLLHVYNFITQNHQMVNNIMFFQC